MNNIKGDTDRMMEIEVKHKDQESEEQRRRRDVVDELGLPENKQFTLNANERARQERHAAEQRAYREALQAKAEAIEAEERVQREAKERAQREAEERARREAERKAAPALALGGKRKPRTRRHKKYNKKSHKKHPKKSHKKHGKSHKRR